MEIRKVLIANRSEIARRIMRTARKLGIATVAVYSEADANALFVQEADECVLIGKAPARDSYLRGDAIIAAAHQVGADAIHPGYGFLSENASFAAATRAAGLTFVGPSPQAIATMGNKLASREIAQRASMPILKASASLKSLDDARDYAATTGFPLMLKPAAGGGGIGMTCLESLADLDKAFETARTRATAAFGEGTLYLEQFVRAPRHIEVQIAADRFGHVVHLGERDCSIQRRNQKLVEETPSPAITEAERQNIVQAALRLCQAVGYDSVGTVEMIWSEGRFYFLEMNTRLQVEHAVTEMVTGIDLVEWQFRLAMGEALPQAQPDIRFTGHAIECRICAEDPSRGFLPSPGTLTSLVLPEGPGIRNDVGVQSGDAITPYYDSLIGKLVAWGETREQALERLRRALDAYGLTGVSNNLTMHQQIVNDSAFVQGEFSTAFLRERLHLKA